MELELIWHQFHNPIKNYVSKRVRDAASVDDIVQNVFLKIYLHIHELKDQGKFQHWVFQITRHAIIDHYRKERPADPLPDELLFDNIADDYYLTQELSRCLRGMIYQLPDKYREALELVELEGMSQKQLSETLGISFSGAKSRVQRGREKLRELITACCHVELDKYGNVLDYYERNKQPTDTCEPKCEVNKRSSY